MTAQDATIDQKLPTLNLAIHPGGSMTLPDDCTGKRTVLYFYPKDDTPGCTKQACRFRDRKKDFEQAGAQVFGVSLDDLASHKDFAAKFSLNFPLIVDAEAELAQFLGVYGDQKWQGKVFKGLSRDSFVICPKGRVEKAWRGVHPEKNIDEILSYLQKD